MAGLQIAAAGKAVLVEKPTAISTSELEEIIAACKANNVQFMDGTMFVHHARMEKMKAVIDDESSFGKMVRMSRCVCVCASRMMLIMRVPGPVNSWSAL